MRKKQMGLLTLVWALLMTQTAFAHHGSSSSAISTQLSSLNGLSIRNAQKPVSLVYLNQEVSFLDEGQGELYTTTLGGSYAISTKLDVGAFVPLRYLQASRRSNEFGLGDMGVQTRFVFFEKNKHFAFAGITLTFPTGRDSVGLGSGFVAQDSQLGCP
ncbi:MAG: hypothetical protein H7A33_05280 [Deltaproteobacteria bacterium]|nr:hypothetical protein [Deltaproteobacteria bacterium]